MAVLDAANLLIVDDDARMRQMLSRYFAGEGYRVSAAADGAAMRARLASDAPDLVLLDVMLPGEDGLTLARELRARSEVGIIMLTGRDEVLDRVVGLEIGADDYVAKPFHLRELLARVKSVLRRRAAAAPQAQALGAAPATEDEVLRFDGWRLDRARRELTAPDGRAVALTTGEFELLRALAERPGRVVDREALMELTRGRARDTFDRTIDAQIARLRKKIEADPKNPTLVKSVRGVGYVFTAKIQR